VCAYHGYLSGTSGHPPTPKDGTYRQLKREALGQPGDPLNPGHYPLSADCKICGRQIFLEQMIQLEWLHVPEPREE
jgi:hypothetical protein